MLLTLLNKLALHHADTKFFTQSRMYHPLHSQHLFVLRNSGITITTPATTVMINEKYLDADFIDKLAIALHSRHPHPNICATPYPLIKFPDFLSPVAFASVKSALSLLPFKARHSDLYEFDQTIDLKSTLDPTIKLLCSSLYSSSFIASLETVMGCKLSPTHVDISGQRYREGHFLLCHDDRLDSRRIAMMIYLTSDDIPSWKQEWGGLLERLDTDALGRPIHGASTFSFPSSNMAAFFEVAPYSYHQVTLMQGGAPERLSITCWFHDVGDAIDKVLPFTLNNDLFNGQLHAFQNISARFKYTNIHLDPLTLPIPKSMLAGKPLYCIYDSNSYYHIQDPQKMMVYLIEGEHPSLELNKWVVVDDWRVEYGGADPLKVLVIPLFALS